MKSRSGVVVKISGTDQNGQRFWQTSMLSDITRRGVRVDQLPLSCRPGDILVVVYEKKQAEYRVVSREINGQVQLIAVSDGQCIFPDRLIMPGKEQFGETAAPRPQSAPAVISPVVSRPSSEKRQHERAPSRLNVEVRRRSGGGSMAGITADVSEGGCYVELTSPMALGTEVEVLGKIAGKEFRFKGNVVTSHPMVGMGIHFSEKHPEIMTSLRGDQAPQPPDSKDTPEPAVALSGSQAEQLFAELMMWFAGHSSLDRNHFFELLRRCTPE